MLRGECVCEKERESMIVYAHVTKECSLFLLECIFLWGKKSVEKTSGTLFFMLGTGKEECTDQVLTFEFCRNF